MIISVTNTSVELNTNSILHGFHITSYFYKKNHIDCVSDIFLPLEKFEVALTNLLDALDE